ncbi:hypothetical protein DAEQUDRAFT_731442 [Daedalea quercina L-15889]|uniref:BZIP domain-containing protein n=1 Tax=Daedalea quercina L-15889 TaxID=1314783 RepID=A0A165M9H2_9APHY|nr:hypothetical protein DAEQUDRAFT_731442 [Daedalea quercina L-15889]
MSRLAAPTALAADAFSSPLIDAPSIPWDAHLQPTGMLYSPAARAAHAQALAGLYALAPSPPHSMSSSGTRAPSPIAPANVLKSRVPSPAVASEQTLCLPTHQVFDIPPGGFPIEHSPSPSPSPPPEERQEEQSCERLSISINPSLAAVPAKRASSSAPSASSSKKPRATTSTKDFVPPDVSGLSKREARLVKNRAAAFLSRQRKREEFECMEIRVAELEQENARLLALSQQAQQPSQDEELLSEVEQLRKQLVEMQERERVLAEELSRKQRSPSPAPSSTSSLKSESSEPQLSALRSTRMDRSGASLGLMVLLCALPTLLSLPSHSHSQSALPSTFTMPLAHATSALPSSALDMQSFLPAHSDFDWLDAMGADAGADYDFNMDFSKEDKTRLASVAVTAATLSGNKLEFVSDDGESQLPLGDLGALDISFDALPSENGKIRVRIHPPSTSVTPSAADSPASSQADEDHAMSISEPSNAPSPASVEADALGPFLGTGANVDFNALMGLNREDELAGLDLDWDSVSGGFSRAGSPGANGRRRVRIALRGMPGKGREGGEWEVEMC